MRGLADSEGGLPVTLAHFGIRTRKLASRWDLDLRVAQCALSTTVSIPGLVPADRDPQAARWCVTSGAGGSGEQTAGD